MYRLIWRSVALATLATRATAQPTATWTLTETLRIGGGDTGPTSFNYIKSIAVDDKGRIFVYDRQAKDIRVFAADGKFVKTIGRVGSGPGELRDAEGIAFAPNGDLWMRDAANARFTVFDGEGRYKYSWTATDVCWTSIVWYETVKGTPTCSWVIALTEAVLIRSRTDRRVVRRSLLKRRDSLRRVAREPRTVRFRLRRRRSRHLARLASGGVWRTLRRTN